MLLSVCKRRNPFPSDWKRQISTHLKALTAFAPHVIIKLLFVGFVLVVGEGVGVYIRGLVALIVGCLQVCQVGLHVRLWDHHALLLLMYFRLAGEGLVVEDLHACVHQ